MISVLTELEKFEILTESCRMALGSYQVWYALESDAKKDYPDELSLFLDFFAVSAIGSFNTLVTATANLVDDSRKQFSIKTFLKQSKKAKPETKETWSEYAREYSALISKLVKIRNNSVAHSSDRQSEFEIFQAFGFRPDEVGEFLIKIRIFLQLLASDLGTSANISDSNRFGNCTLLLLSTIKQLPRVERQSVVARYLQDPK